MDTVRLFLIISPLSHHGDTSHVHPSPLGALETHYYASTGVAELVLGW